MTEEIKEILDRLERIDHKEYSCGFEFADSGSFDEDCRCFEERKIMADYITNLQQEINKLTAESTEWESKYYDLQQENKNLKQDIENYVKITLHDRKEIERLQKENEKLQITVNNCKQENERLTENNQAMQVEMARTWKIADDYKSRCEKAIKEINYWGIDKEHNDNSAMRLALGNILNILNGENND